MDIDIAVYEDRIEELGTQLKKAQKKAKELEFRLRGTQELLNDALGSLDVFLVKAKSGDGSKVYEALYHRCSSRLIDVSHVLERIFDSAEDGSVCACMRCCRVRDFLADTK